MCVNTQGGKNMKDRVKIPAIPTKNCRFEEGTLKFDVLSGCAYAARLNDSDRGGFVGGHWKQSHFKTADGSPAWVRLDGGNLVVEKLVNYLVEQDTGYLVGGERVELARLSICD